MPEDAGTIYSAVMLKLDQLQSGVVRVETAMNRIHKVSKEKASGFAGFWKNAFQTAFGFGIVQIIGKVTAALRGAFDVFSGFQQSMRNTQSVTQAVGEEMRIMEEAAKDAGETTRFTARQAADALYYLGSAGFTAQQSVEALDGVLKLAGATGSDLASTSETVAAVISQYSLKAKDATKISNVFAAAITNSQATMQKLTASFQQVGPVAAGFGFTVEQTVGALQELYNAGFRGQAAGRALKSALADLASPTANMEKIFKKLNISIEDVNPTTNELIDIIDVLAKSGADTSDIIEAFGKIAGPQMAVLISQGSDSLRKYTDAVTGTNAATEAYKIQNDSLAGSMDFLQSKLESTAIAIFEKLEPGMRDLITSIIDFLDASRPLGEALGVILNFLLKIASFSVNIVTGVFQGLLGAFRDMRTPMQEITDDLDGVRESIQKISEIDTAVNRIEELTDEYEKLTAKTDLTEQEQDRLKAVIQELADKVPEAATGFNKYGDALDINTAKTREAARQMLSTREAIVLEAKSRLELQIPILKNTIELYGEEAKRLKERRVSLSKDAKYQQQLLSETRTFWNVYNKNLKEGKNQVEAYEAAVMEMVDTFSLLSHSLVDTRALMKYYETGDIKGIKAKTKSLKDGIFEVNRTATNAEKAINDLYKALEKESEVEIKVTDARNKLKEINNLAEELRSIQLGLSNLDKIDPVENDAANKVSTLDSIANEFWDNYNKNLNRAITESKTFGNEQDILNSKLNFLKSAYLELLEQGLDPTGKTLTKLRQEYDLTAAELEEYIRLEKENIESIKEKEKADEKIIELTEKYREKLEELKTPEEELIELERQRAIESVMAAEQAILNSIIITETSQEAITAATEKSQEAIQEAIEAINEYYDELGKNSKKSEKDFKSNSQEILNTAANLASSLNGLFNQITTNRLEQLDRQLQAELAAKGLLEQTELQRLNNELAAAIKAGDVEKQKELENSIARYEIEEKYEKKKARLQYKASLTEWGLMLSRATALLAEAILKATAALPWPFNLPAIGYAVAAGVNVGTVAASKPSPPSFDSGGIFEGSSLPGPTGGYMAELHGEEMVLNKDQIKTLFNTIKSGNLNNNERPIQVSVTLQLDKYDIGKAVAEVANDGQITFTSRAFR